MYTYISSPWDVFSYFSPVLLFFIWYNRLLTDCGLHDPREVRQVLCNAASDLLHWSPLCTIFSFIPGPFQIQIGTIWITSMFLGEQFIISMHFWGLFHDDVSPY